MRKVNRLTCPKCGSSEVERGEKTFECEHVTICLDVCLQCEAEFLTYEAKKRAKP